MNQKHLLLQFLTHCFATTRMHFQWQARDAAKRVTRTFVTREFAIRHFNDDC